MWDSSMQQTVSFCFSCYMYFFQIIQHSYALLHKKIIIERILQQYGQQLIFSERTDINCIILGSAMHFTMLPHEKLSFCPLIHWYIFYRKHSSYLLTCRPVWDPSKLMFPTSRPCHLFYCHYVSKIENYFRCSHIQYNKLCELLSVYP